jgi:uncharacterized spore protein YtfJ
MAQKKIVIEPELTVGDITIIPVVELTTGYSYSDYGIYCFARKNPVAVILVRGKERQLLLIEELSPPVDKLLAEVPQLSAILNF